MHTIHPYLLRRTIKVAVVGCGGTGSAIVGGLPHLHQALIAGGHPAGLAVTVIDGDRISAANCVRQPFSASEIGLFKSVVLINRLNLFWGLDWQAVPQHLTTGHDLHNDLDLVIGCVDSRSARAKIHEALTSPYCGIGYWLDIGNNADPILRVGVERAHRYRCGAIDAVLKAYPTLQIGAVWVRLGELRNRRNSAAGTKANGSAAVDGEADSATEGTCLPPSGGCVWTARMDAIMLDGVRQANRCEREAVDKVLGAFSELRVCAIWARLRRLRYQRRTNAPVAWTNELDERLIRICLKAGLSAAVSDIQKLTDWPRRAILRRAHQLGSPTEPTSDRRRWTMAEFRFVIESVSHVSVKEIADDLDRSEKAVWDMLTRRGIPARFQDGYSVREISTKLHIRRPSVRTWVKSGLLHKKRNGRIAEDSLQSYLYHHPESINWALLDEDASFWATDLIEAEKIKANGAGTQTRANCRSTEGPREAGSSIPGDIASSTPEADPSVDLVSHNIRARGASPQQ